MKTAVIIGDSHVDPTNGLPFGPLLAARLTAQGYSTTLAGVGATSARMWATQNPVCNTNNRCVDKHLLPAHPDLLVISLGTNDAANALAGGQAVSGAVADVQRLIASLAPKHYFWIGPPAMRGNVQYYTPDGAARFYAAADASDISIFDSRPSTQAAVMAGSGDGVHPGAQGAQAWADSVSKAISSQSSGTGVKVAIGFAVVASLLLLWRKGYI